MLGLGSPVGDLWSDWNGSDVYLSTYPRHSMYGIFTYILVHFYGKCRSICHTLSIWAIEVIKVCKSIVTIDLRSRVSIVITSDSSERFEGTSSTISSILIPIGSHWFRNWKVVHFWGGDMVCPKIPPGPWWFVPHAKNGEKYDSTKPSELIPQREFFDLQAGKTPAFPCKWRKTIPILIASKSWVFGVITRLICLYPNWKMKVLFSVTP